MAKLKNPGSIFIVEKVKIGGIDWDIVPLPDDNKGIVGLPLSAVSSTFKTFGGLFSTGLLFLTTCSAVIVVYVVSDILLF